MGDRGVGMPHALKLRLWARQVADVFGTGHVYQVGSSLASREHHGRWPYNRDVDEREDRDFYTGQPVAAAPAEPCADGHWCCNEQDHPGTTHAHFLSVDACCPELAPAAEETKP